jgi:hypothetical protein
MQQTLEPFELWISCFLGQGVTSKLLLLLSQSATSTSTPNHYT